MVRYLNVLGWTVHYYGLIVYPSNQSDWRNIALIMIIFITALQLTQSTQNVKYMPPPPSLLKGWNETKDLLMLFCTWYWGSFIYTPLAADGSHDEHDVINVA